MLTNNTSHVHLESICHTGCQLVMTWLFLHCHHRWKVKSIVFWNFCFGCFCCTKRCKLTRSILPALYSPFLSLQALPPISLSVGQLSYTPPQCSHPSLCFIMSSTPPLLISLPPLIHCTSLAPIIIEPPAEPHLVHSAQTHKHTHTGVER